MPIAEPDVKAVENETPAILDHVPGDDSPDPINDQIDPVDEPADPAADPAAPAAPAAPDPIEELRTSNAALQARIDELNEKFETKAGDLEKKDAPPEPAKEPTAEEWSQHEKAWGFFRSKDENGGDVISMDPQKVIKTVVSRLGYVLDQAKAYTDQTVHGNVSDIRFDSALSTMAGKAGFQDIRSYSESIKKILDSRYLHKNGAIRSSLRPPTTNPRGATKRTWSKASRTPKKSRRPSFARVYLRASPPRLVGA